MGLPPGTLMYIGKQPPAETRITIIHYDPAQVEEKEARTLEECFTYKDQPTVTWINVDGLDVELIARLGHCFEVPPLVLEDILNTEQRPKLEDFGNTLSFVVKMLHCEPRRPQIMIEQVSFVLGPNFLLSFQERSGDVFDPIRARLKNGKGHLRNSGADCLAYALLDTVVDNYFLVLEHLGEKIETVEEEVLNDPSPETARKIHHLKREMIFLRKAVWPLRELVTALSREEVELITPATRRHLHDVYDHVVQVIETIEAYREMLAGLLEIYLSTVSNKMNEVMKVLTVIATIFIPLSFIADVYDLNFFNPQIHWPWGYFTVLSLMIVLAMVMLLYFRRKKWL